MPAATPDILPDDPTLLKQMLLHERQVVAEFEVERAEFQSKINTVTAECTTVQSQLATVTAECTTVQSQLATVTAERDSYKARLALMLQRTFGKRAETLDDNQLELFAEEIQRIRDTVGDDQSERLPVDANKPQPKIRKKPKRKPLPGDLPRVVIEHDLPDDEKPCPGCGEDRVEIARSASEQLEIKPVEFYVVRHERLVYACPSCRNQVQRADKPYQPIERSIAGPSVLAHLVTSKWEDHLPLYRIEKMLKRAGIVLSRSTQADLMRKTAELVEPLVKLMWERVRGSPVIHTDDTTMPTQEKGRGKTRTGRLWPYIGRHGAPWDVANSYVVVEYTNSRDAKHVRRHLDGWTGDLLQSDCYAGYCHLDSARQIACWAHARRKFHEARLTNIAGSTRALAFISSLYEIEQSMQARDLNIDAIRMERNERSRPLVASFMEWLIQERGCPKVLPKSPLGQAIRYVLNHRPAFEAYLDDGRLAIDNNLAERLIRPIAVGRKNFLFAGSERGGRTMATLMSLVSSARLHEVNVHAYVTDVITRISGHPLNKLSDLLPDRWQALQTPAD